jgi:hypothetical protein
MRKKINTPDAVIDLTAKEKYEKKMAKYLANKARRSQKEHISYTTSNEFNYSEYINAPYKSVNYINDNTFEIVVGAGGDYHYKDDYDNAAVEILNNTKFLVVKNKDSESEGGRYFVVEAFGKSMTSDKDFEKLTKKQRVLFNTLCMNFMSYSKEYDYTPTDFTHWVRHTMRPMSITDTDLDEWISKNVKVIDM